MDIQPAMLTGSIQNGIWTSFWMPGKPGLTLIYILLNFCRMRLFDATVTFLFSNLVPTLPLVRQASKMKIKVIDVLHQQSGMVPLTPEEKAKADRRLFKAEIGIPNGFGVKKTHNEVVFTTPKFCEPGAAFDYSPLLLYTPSWPKIASERVVSERMLQRIQTTGTEEIFLKGDIGPALAGAFGETPVASTYQWDAVFADGDLYKGGIQNQGIYVSPGRDVVVVWYATGYPKKAFVEPFARRIATSLN